MARTWTKLCTYLALLFLLVSCQKIAAWMILALGQPAKPQLAGPSSVAQRNAQLLQEIYRVVWVMHPPGPSEFGIWLDVLNQGASFEGVYNAFSHSRMQRKLESDPASTASPGALRTFSGELARIALVFREVPEWQEEDSQALQVIQTSDESALRPSVRPKQLDFAPLAGRDQGGAARPSVEALASRIASVFNGSSVFTLKRVLGDWALRAMEYRRAESAERLWEWYADFALEASKKRVDFGIRERNDTDRSFHRNWASRSSEDLVRWEVLNRLHRLMNAAQPLQIEAQL